MATTMLRFLSLILAALLAGTSFGIWMGFDPVNFSPSTYVEIQQNTVRMLNALMVSLVVVATIITLACAYLQRHDKSIFKALLVASLFFIACIVISAFGNRPIQNYMLTWTTASLPADWEELRDQWWSFHILRTIAELIALAIIAWVSIKKGNTNSPGRVSKVSDIRNDAAGIGV